MASPNPNWPNFPGLPNLTQDADGRPQLLDLIPGKQRGTPLTTQFFNPLLRKICDLQDRDDSLSSTALSGTAGMAAGDTAGVGLHINHGTGRVTFGAAGGNWRDLAWGTDVDSLSQQVQEGLQTAVSGTYGMTPGDFPGLGLHTNHTSGKPVYLDKNGSRDLALAADVQAAVSGTYGMGGGDSAGLGLHTNGSTGKPVYLDKTGARDLALAADFQGVLSGTAGLGPSDIAGVGLHLNNGTGRATFGAAGRNWRDLAWGSDVDSLSQQVQEGLQAAVSGTYGMGAGDSAGLGLHTNHTSGKPVYLDKNGSRDLALATDVQGVLSGTVGLAPGDTSGVGLHVNHASDRPTFGDNAGRWRDLALATDLDSRLPVSNPTASGSIAINNNGATMGINPNTSFNGQLRGQITWGTRAWYPGGDGLIITDRGSYIVDAANASGPTTVQRFTAQGAHGNKIAFPQQYSNDNVQAILLAQDSGGNTFHNVNYFTIDRYGVVPSLNAWTGSGYTNENRLTWMIILVFGSMV